MSIEIGRLAVSNIAWPSEEEPDVAEALHSLGVERVEVAPTKVFDDPLAVTPRDIAEYRGFWREHDIEIVAMQSMLFGRPDLTLFDDAVTRAATLDRLSRFIELAGRLQVTALVFGSPKNRVRPESMTREAAKDVAVAFFDALGTVAADNGTCFCIEPNPSDYGCNFVTTAAEGIELVDLVGNAGFGLHLDLAGMTLAGDDVSASIVAAGDRLRHFHVSAPNLGEISRELTDHAAAASALEEIGYAGTVSIEMRPGEPGDAVSRVTAAVGIAKEFYSA